LERTKFANVFEFAELGCEIEVQKENLAANVVKGFVVVAAVGDETVVQFQIFALFGKRANSSEEHSFCEQFSTLIVKESAIKCNQFQKVLRMLLQGKEVRGWNYGGEFAYVRYLLTYHLFAFQIHALPFQHKPNCNENLSLPPNDVLRWNFVVCDVLYNCFGFERVDFLVLAGDEYARHSDYVQFGRS
jgi:hypothetical protein